MRLLIHSAVLAVLFCASPLFAQPIFSGEPFALTHARYAVARGANPLLLSNGREPVLFWSDGTQVRMTRIVASQPSIGRAIFPASDLDTFDAVWTGEHFLVVGTQFPLLGIGKIVGARIAANGEPIGQPFLIIGQQLLEGGRHPRIAFNGEHVLLMYIGAFGFDVHMQLLHPDGTPADTQPRSLHITSNGRIALTSNGDSFVAVIPRDLEPRLLLFDRNGSIRSDSVFGAYGSGLSIATDGQRYLAVGACGESGACGPAYARLVEADGSVGPAVDLDAPFPRLPSSVWTGSEWVVSYVRNVVPDATLQLVHLDPTARVVSKREQRDSSGGSLAVIGGRLITAEVRGRQLYDTVYIDGVPASFAATRQMPLATSSSADAALVVWQEIGDHRTTLHAGTRARDGRWREHPIASVPVSECCYEHQFSALTASDGQNFLLVTYKPESGPFAQRLDSEGKPVGARIALEDPSVDQIVFDGDEYLLINSAARTAARLSTTGVLTPPAALSPLVRHSAKYASDGNGNLFAVWVVTTYVDHVPVVMSLDGIRLGPDLQALDAAPRTVAHGQVSSPAIEFDGTQYTVAWIGVREVMSAHVSTAGAIRVQRIAEEPAISVRVERIADGTAITWRNNASDFVPFVNRLAFLRQDGTVSDPFGISAQTDLGLLTALPNGDLGIVEALPLWGPPTEGMPRVTMRLIASALPPPKPDAPRTTLEGLVLSWTPPAQPVDGYRVEHRIGDGPWIETGSTYDAEQHSLAVPRTPGVRNSYRVRAWNGGGTGAYSNVVSVGNPRRRAVR